MNRSVSFSNNYLEYLSNLISKLDRDSIGKFVDLLLESRDSGSTTFFLGNGGSASTATHFVNDISLGSRQFKKPFRAISLCDNQAVITAIANDDGYENIFLQQLQTLAKPGDTIVCISASGNSKNLIKAIEYANNNKVPTIVDPKINNFKHYKDCTIFKPNLKEIINGMNIDVDENSQESLKKATDITRKELNAKGLLLTLSSKGICINTEKEFQYTPSFKRDIIDVSGAGDTVVSVAAMCLTSNIEYSILAKLSNLAGGIVCEDVGVVPINKRKLLSEAIKHIN